MALPRPTLHPLTHPHRSPRLAMNSAHLAPIFLPPSNRSMRELDRSFFQKTLPIAAATVFDDRNLSAVRDRVQRAGSLLGVFGIKAVVVDQTVSGGRKCVLLTPGIVAAGLFCLFFFLLLFMGMGCGLFLGWVGLAVWLLISLYVCVW